MYRLSQPYSSSRSGTDEHLQKNENMKKRKIADSCDHTASMGLGTKRAGTSDIEIVKGSGSETHESLVLHRVEDGWSKLRVVVARRELASAVVSPAIQCAFS